MAAGQRHRRVFVWVVGSLGSLPDGLTMRRENSKDETVASNDRLNTLKSHCSSVRTLRTCKECFVGCTKGITLGLSHLVLGLSACMWLHLFFLAAKEDGKGKKRCEYNVHSEVSR